MKRFLLSCLVMPLCVISPNISIGEPTYDVAKLSVMAFAECVFIRHHSPCTERLRKIYGFNVFNLSIIDKFINDSTQDESLIWSQVCGTANLLGKGKCKIIWQRKIHNRSLSPESNIMCWGLTGIKKNWFGFKAQILFSLLINSTADNYRQICTQLQASGHVHSFYCLPQHCGLNPEYDQLKKSDQPKYGSQTNQPPIGRRLIFLFLSFTGCFFGILWGWKLFDDQRRFLGAALVALSLWLGAASLALWWAIGLRSTWGWLL